ncbi:sulfite exporter TauE/SafE family protein 3-like [Magnolia sinica]|uniref:sulfite exporter TauE/SafE family protein 3-like n=1 Tax=Magnolia sinica TaxID=86752 RepID=UPI00265A73C7|nr:sulfite exporter TauE/SafE family protein 3-like [Magnolia sinica]
MAVPEEKWRIMRTMAVGVVVYGSFIIAGKLAAAERPLKPIEVGTWAEKESATNGFLTTLIDFLWLRGRHHVWPEMEFGWRIVLGSIIGFFGAALGSIGGVGGGGIFVPMLTLIIGFDAKSSTAISKCMIMGAAGSTVYYNLTLRHPTLNLPIIDYDLALLFQPMLMLGISIGIAFNVIFADWMVTVLLIILFLVTSTRAFFKGIETWKKETIMKKEAAKLLESSSSKVNDSPQLEYKPLPSSPTANRDTELSPDDEVTIIENVYWKELAVLIFVWIAFLIVQIMKTYAPTCSMEYWVLNSLQVPIAVAVTLYEAICLYTGRRVVTSKGKQCVNWKMHQLFLYCCCGILAGIVGGLLGLGGGFILGPLLLELGVPPQVASATSTFVMVFSSSMSVVQNYLLNRFPIPYAAYFILIAIIAAIIGQHVVRKLVTLFGRASLIIFILALTIFVSAISLGGVGILDMIEKLEHHEYMGFESLC